MGEFMEIMKMFEAKRKKLWNGEIPTIAFLGDSITQGCFEFYMRSEKEFSTVFDSENSYPEILGKMLKTIFPSVPVNIINAGISGDNAVGGAMRVERDILSRKPHLTVVSFGLNDTFEREEGLEKYKNSLEKIFSSLKEGGSEVIFMTQNMMNTYVSCHIKEPYFIKIAEDTMERQNGGIVDLYFDGAREIAEKYDVSVCDVYEKWKRMESVGVDTTELLANYINHPKREMQSLFASSILEMLI